MVINRIDTQADDLAIALLESWLKGRHRTQLCRADGREILRMRKEDAPSASDPVVKADRPFGRVCLEIRGTIANLQSRTEESRVGKECVSTCISQGSPYHQ